MERDGGLTAVKISFANVTQTYVHVNTFGGSSGSLGRVQANVGP